MRSILKHRWLILVFGMVTLAAAFGGTALANHQFSDVPDSNPFHGDIGAIRGAGITTGFPDGTYRPAEGISREAMAAFVHRGAGRVGRAEGFVTATTSDTNVTAASRTLTAGAVGTGAGGFVLVTGTAHAFRDAPTNCPCALESVLSDGTTSGGSPSTYATLPGATDEFGRAETTLPNTWVFPIAAGQTKTFTLQARFIDTNVGSVNFIGELTALYVPFGPTGTNVLEP